MQMLGSPFRNVDAMAHWGGGEASHSQALTNDMDDTPLHCSHHQASSKTQADYLARPKDVRLRAK